MSKNYTVSRIIKEKINGIKQRFVEDSQRGNLIQLESGDNFKHLAFVEMKQGEARGKHFHRKKREKAFIIRGTVKIIMYIEHDKSNHQVILSKGDHIIIEPGVPHAYLPLEDSEMIEYSQIAFDYKDNIIYEFEQFD